MDCRVVRIFRKHNFAWGGNFLLPDGMHFEWVGEPRNTQQYPSRYCPNLANGAIQSMVLQGGSRSTLFADDGWALTGD
jgi:D-alanyl-D-alanine carboxypeptidase